MRWNTKSKPLVVGSIHSTNQYGDVAVINDDRPQSVTVVFLRTMNVVKTRRHLVKRGAVKDNMMPKISGVGFIGIGPYTAKDLVTKKNSIAYSKWSGMLTRCYDDRFQLKNPTYKGCVVCKEWHNFQNFAQWFYDNYPNDGGRYHLDKDLSAYGERGKLYSPETCCFVTHQINCEEACAKHYKMRNPSGEIVDIYNLAAFCRKLGMTELERRGMNAVTLGKIKQFQGWTAVT